MSLMKTKNILVKCWLEIKDLKKKSIFRIYYSVLLNKYLEIIINVYRRNEKG